MKSFGPFARFWLPLILLLTLFIFKYSLLPPSESTPINTTDYPNYYFAGLRWLEGTPIYRPFDDDLQAITGTGGYKAYTADTPAAVILLSPLSFLSLEAGMVLLNHLSIILCIVAMFLLARSKDYSIRGSILVCAFALSSFPFFFLLKRAHMEAVILLAGVLGIVAANSKRLRSAGCIFGAAAALKLFPFIWLIPYLIKWRKETRAIFLAGAIAFAVLTALSFILVGWENVMVFIFQVIPRSKEWYGVAGNYSLISYFTALFGFESAIIPSLISALLVLILFVKSIALDALSHERAYSASTAAALLITPLSWVNYFVLTFPIIIFLFRSMNFSLFADRVIFAGLFIAWWNWPEYIETPWPALSLQLSFFPMFALGAFLILLSSRKIKL